VAIGAAREDDASADEGIGFLKGLRHIASAGEKLAIACETGRRSGRRQERRAPAGKQQRFEYVLGHPTLSFDFQW
jgi:hypothetical protein